MILEQNYTFYENRETQEKWSCVYCIEEYSNKLIRIIELNKSITKINSDFSNNITYNIINLNKIDNSELSKVLGDLNFLYKKNFDSEKFSDFLEEYFNYIDQLLNSNSFNMYIFYYEGTPLLSMFFSDMGNSKKFFWWFYSNNDIKFKNMWFDVLENVLDYESYNYSIESILWQNIQWIENSDIGKLFIKYKELWFYISNPIKWKHFKWLKIVKDNS